MDVMSAPLHAGKLPEGVTDLRIIGRCEAPRCTITLEEIRIIARSTQNLVTLEIRNVQLPAGVMQAVRTQWFTDQLQHLKLWNVGCANGMADERALYNVARSCANLSRVHWHVRDADPTEKNNTAWLCGNAMKTLHLAVPSRPTRWKPDFYTNWIAEMKGKAVELHFHLRTCTPNRWESLVQLLPARPLKSSSSVSFHLHTRYDAYVMHDDRQSMVNALVRLVLNSTDRVVWHLVLGDDDEEGLLLLGSSLLQVQTQVNKSSHVKEGCGLDVWVQQTHDEVSSLKLWIQDTNASLVGTRTILRLAVDPECDWLLRDEETLAHGLSRRAASRWRWKPCDAWSQVSPSRVDPTRVTHC